MLTAQIRAARALLGLRQDELAKQANRPRHVHIEQRDGVVQGYFGTVLKSRRRRSAPG